jgi:hypothetical protein
MVTFLGEETERFDAPAHQLAPSEYFFTTRAQALLRLADHGYSDAALPTRVRLSLSWVMVDRAAP